ncbi:hypothetical protein PENSPDRAFT_342213 [Peniophora sp. CONT]|nr:hypothetical protein PENSPDRAFT_342213 [Peniophora sp. CONT]
MIIFTQFLISTGHAVSLIFQAIRGFIDPPSLPLASSTAWHSLPPGVSRTEAYFQNLSSPEHTVEVALYILNSFVTDCFMTWRVYVVWNSQVALATPFIILNTVILVFSALAVQNNTQVNYDLLKYFGGSGRHRILTVWAVSLVTQTAGSLLIAYRRMSTPVYVAPTKGSRWCKLTTAVCVIIDSGAIYTLGIMLTLGFYLHERAEGAIVIAILGQISATVPLSIILREWWTMKIMVGLQRQYLPRPVLFQHSRQSQRRSHLSADLPQDHNGIGVNISKTTYIQRDTDSNPFDDTNGGQ